MVDNHNEHQTSTWHEWIGYASADRNPDGSLSVFVPELTPNATGSIEASTATSNINLMAAPTTTGGAPTPVQSTVNLTNSIIATYIGMTNSKYPPYVRKGEQVRVTKYGDQDRYYWESMGRNPELRTVETHRIEVANNSTAGGTPLTDDNTYFAEFSSEHKRVLIKTSTSNGEKHKYQILIDTAAGSISICDEQNDEILIDSTIPRVRFRNNQDCMIDMVKQSIIISAPQDIILKADRQILFVTPTLTMMISGVISMIAKAIGLKGSGKIVLTTPTTGIGPVTISGNTISANQVQGQTVNQGVAPPPAQTAPTTNINDGTSNG